MMIFWILFVVVVFFVTGATIIDVKQCFSIEMDFNFFCCCCCFCFSLSYRILGCDCGIFQFNPIFFSFFVFILLSRFQYIHSRITKAIGGRAKEIKKVH